MLSMLFCFDVDVCCCCVCVGFVCEISNDTGRDLDRVCDCSVRRCTIIGEASDGQSIAIKWFSVLILPVC